eukprot:TRINITY_DN100955_c0_g1_i1.p2 TRINITY_DN100955_c0_g1~~TRINITY_DN100955_c0_g1_i1.p2  ORF type:complete len:221 (+),score=15.44 TRINITY_DN100955_c0_g1_i1:263-925(+)
MDCLLLTALSTAAFAALLGNMMPPPAAGRGSTPTLLGVTIATAATVSPLGASLASHSLRPTAKVLGKQRRRLPGTSGFPHVNTGNWLLGTKPGLALAWLPNNFTVYFVYITYRVANSTHEMSTTPHAPLRPAVWWSSAFFLEGRHLVRACLLLPAPFTAAFQLCPATRCFHLQPAGATPRQSYSQRRQLHGLREEQGGSKGKGAVKVSGMVVIWGYYCVV